MYLEVGYPTSHRDKQDKSLKNYGSFFCCLAVSVADELRGKTQKLKYVRLLASTATITWKGGGVLQRLDFELRMNKIIFGVYYYDILHRAIQPTVSAIISTLFFTHRRRSTLVKLGRLTSRMKIKFYLFKTHFSIDPNVLLNVLKSYNRTSD